MRFLVWFALVSSNCRCYYNCISITPWEPFVRNLIQCGLKHFFFFFGIKIGVFIYFPVGMHCINDYWRADFPAMTLTHLWTFSFYFIGGKWLQLVEFIMFYLPLVFKNSHGWYNSLLYVLILSRRILCISLTHYTHYLHITISWIVWFKIQN